MYNPFSLAAKIILVTGASSGIGKAIAIECSKMGATLIISGRNEAKLRMTLSELEGDGHVVIMADLTQESDIINLVSQLPVLDGFVQNAGISSRTLCKDVSVQNFRDIITTNLEAPVLLQRYLLEKKRLKKEASIVYITSRAPFAPALGNAVYSASKGGLIAYARVLALELAPRKIRVNCICPAFVQTDLLLSDETMTQENIDNIRMKYPLKRLGRSEDVAHLTIYLLSEASSWMTGSCLDITGGGEGLLTL